MKFVPSEKNPGLFWYRGVPDVGQKLLGLLCPPGLGGLRDGPPPSHCILFVAEVLTHKFLHHALRNIHLLDNGPHGTARVSVYKVLKVLLQYSSFGITVPLVNCSAFLKIIRVASSSNMHISYTCIPNDHRWALSPISVISDIGLSLISELPISDWESEVRHYIGYRNIYLSDIRYPTSQFE